MERKEQQQKEKKEEQEEGAAFEMCLEPAGHRRRQPK